MGKVPHDRPSRGTPSLETWAKTDESRRGAQIPEKRLAGNHTVNIADQALGWPTPKASAGNKPSAGKRRDGATTLCNTPVNGLLGRQVLKTGTAGSDSSGVRRTLNPLFVETLTGWPAGWTGFGSAATAWSRWLPRMRGELSRLGSMRRAPKYPRLRQILTAYDA